MDDPWNNLIIRKKATTAGGKVKPAASSGKVKLAAKLAEAVKWLKWPRRQLQSSLALISAVN
jgi:hypothetical protein